MMTSGDGSDLMRYLVAPHGNTGVVAIREAFWAVAGRAA